MKILKVLLKAFICSVHSNMILIQVAHIIDIWILDDAINFCSIIMFHKLYHICLAFLFSEIAYISLIKFLFLFCAPLFFLTCAYES